MLWVQYQHTMSQQAQFLGVWEPAVTQASVLGRAQAGASEALNNAVIRSEVRRPDRLERLLGQMRQSSLRLRALLADEPTERALLGAAVTSQEAWLREDLSPTLEALGQGNPARAAELTSSDASADRTEAMQQDSRALHARVQGRSMAQSQSMASAGQALRDVFAVVMALLVLVIALGALAIRLAVVRPLDRLRGSLRSTVVDPSHLQPVAVGGPTDIAMVARDAEGLRRQLVDEMDDARGAREALGLQAPLVAMVRESLHGQTPPELPQMDVFAASRPGFGVIAGDWWQFVQRTDRIWCLGLADVSGHGWQSGLIALQMRAVVDSWLRTRAGLPSVLAAVAAELGSGQHTIPTVLIELDVHREQIRYVNAGHPPPLLVRAGGQVASLGRTGPLLSCLPTPATSWATEVLRWSRGDALVAYSDGLTDVGRSAASPGTKTDADQWLTEDVRSRSARAPLAAAELGARLLATARARAVTNGGDLVGADDVSLIVVTNQGG